MSDDDKEDRPTLWPPQSLVEEAQRTWAAVTGKAVTEDEARSVVLGIANLFDVVGVDRLAQPEDEE
jgi:hypothetical protein